MINRFEETGKLGIQPVRGRIYVTAILVGAVKTAAAALSQVSEFGGNSECASSRQTGFSYNAQKHTTFYTLLSIQGPTQPKAVG